VNAAELADMLQTALARAGEAEADAMAVHQQRGFARFAAGDLSQHMSLSEPRVHVRVARGKRIAEVSVGLCDEAAVVAAIGRAAILAASMPEDDSFPGFETGDAACPNRSHAVGAQTSPEARADRIAGPIERIHARGLFATGALETRVTHHAVANSHGLRRAHDSSFANYRIWALEAAGARGAAGFAQSVGAELDALDIDAATRRAIADAERSKSPIALDAQAYDVVLAPDAVAELFEWLAFIAFGAESLHQGTSPLAGRIGETISGTALSVCDDPHGALSFATPFDREGTPRTKVDLISDGIARGVVTDRRWAARSGGRSTGHAPWPSLLDSGAPQPSALVLSAGTERDLDQLLGHVRRGLYIRRLHYVNGLLEPRRAVMTGLSRDGTFLVENGKVQRAAHPLRFTDSILEAFARGALKTSSQEVVPPRWSDGATVATPAVLLPGLVFTGSSQAH
jgi:predicted Zn-dependent protease